jgi:phospholipase C
MLTRRAFVQLVGASGAAMTASELLDKTVANAAPARSPHGSEGIEHVVVLMMENRSFDHFLGWLPDADGRHDMVYQARDGNWYPNYPLAPDFQGCGYSDPDHSWEGWLVEHNYGKMDGFLKRPSVPPDNPGVRRARANTFPIGYYTNHHQDGRRKEVPDLPVTGALAEHYTVLDRYFSSFAGETFPNRLYQHCGRTDRDHNLFVPCTLPAIWDQLSPIPNSRGVPTGGYFFRDLPFLSLWGTKYLPFWHYFADGDADVLGIPVKGRSFTDSCARGDLPNVSFVDPAFDNEGTGTSADDHPLADIRLGERFIADAYHALARAGYLDSTVFVVTFDEWGGFFDHVPPPQVIDDTNPADVDHSGDGRRPTDGRRFPDYRQLGFRVPCIVVSELAGRKVVHDGPYEHASTLKLIETTFGLHAMTARDAHARNLGEVLGHEPRNRVREAAIPWARHVTGPANDAAAVCGAHSVQSVSPHPVRRGRPDEQQGPASLSGWPTGSGMAGLADEYGNIAGTP